MSLFSKVFGSGDGGGSKVIMPGTSEHILGIAVDGSGMLRTSRRAAAAGWGYLGVFYSCNPSDEYVQYLPRDVAGPVITNKRGAGYIGARVATNNTSEVTGQVKGLEWANTLCWLHLARIIILYDSVWAADLVRGRTVGWEHRELTAHAEQVLTAAEGRTEVLFQHVRGAQRV